MHKKLTLNIDQFQPLNGLQICVHVNNQYTGKFKFVSKHVCSRNDIYASVINSYRLS